jgi:hypothetical protein
MRLEVVKSVVWRAEGLRVVSVILVDLGDDKHDVMVSNAGWRDTVAVLRPLGVLDEERLRRLETTWLGQELNQQEARAVGEALVAGPLAAVYWSDDVYPPDGYWRDARRGKPEFDPGAYWPSWLRAFAGFCLTCRGFVAY